MLPLVRTPIRAERKKEFRLTGAALSWKLPVGVYRVVTSMQGFKTKVQQHINLRVSDRIKLDLRLEPGETKETVVVTA